MDYDTHTDSNSERDYKIRTRDMFLLTPFGTDIGPSEHQYGLPQDNESTDSHFIKSRPHMISSIDSLLSFVHYLSILPEGTINILYDEQDAAMLFYGNRDIRLLGNGMSFMVQAERDFAIPEEAKIASWKDKSTKPSVVAVKFPRIDRHEFLRFGGETEAKCLRSIAWECHVLSHPAVRASENIINMYGLTWRSAFAGKDGGRRVLPALVMELASEGALNEYLISETFRLTYAMKWKLVLGVAKGLETLHRHGIIHGDVKAENVLLSIDQQGELVAKLTDFASSIHDFGAAAQEQLPGRSPPWDAPEVRLKSVARSMLYKTDIYSFGLLIWRIMLDCRTPFEDPSISNIYPAFGNLSRGGRSEKASWIQDLKDKEDDELLAKIRTTLPGHGLDTHQVSDILHMTIRNLPTYRASSLTEILEAFTPLQAPKAPPTPLMQQPSDISMLRPVMDHISADRLSAGFGNYSKPYIPDIVGRIAKVPIPEEVQRHILGDLEAQEEDPEHAVDVSLCYFTGFGCLEDHQKGLKAMLYAALKGNIRARAVCARLHQACGELLPDEIPIIEWLREATSAGSFIAWNDLRKLDPAALSTVTGMYGFGLSGFPPLAAIRHVLVDDLCLTNGVFDELKLANAVQRHSSSRDPEIEYNGWYLLHYAANFGHRAMIEKLLEWGVNIDRKNFLGETPLLCACRAGHLDCATLLLDDQADPKIPDHFGSTPLHYMIYLDPIPAANLSTKLIASGANVNAKSVPMPSSRDAERFIGEPQTLHDTPLHWAVLAGRFDVCHNLLSAGANPLESSQLLEVVDFFHMSDMFTDLKLSSPTAELQTTSPLYEAYTRAQMDMVTLFVEKLTESEKSLLPKFNAMDVVRSPSFIYMCIHGKYYKEAMTRASSYEDSSLEPIEYLGRATLGGSQVLAEHAIEQGCNVNQVIPMPGLTPLQLSCTRPNGAMTLFLLLNGADSHVRGSGSSASCTLLMAMRPIGTHRKEIISELIRKGDTYETEPKSFTMLYSRAVKEGWNAIASELLDHCNQKTEMEDNIVLEILSDNNEASIGPLMFLLEPLHRYAPSSPISRTGSTVFHQLAAIAENTRNDELNYRLAKYLITKFPQVDLLNKLDRKNATAMSLATRKGNHYLVSKLLQAGADPNAGFISAIMYITDRIFNPDDFGSEFKDIAARERQSGRFEENSLKILAAIFLKVVPEIRSSSDTNEDLSQLRKLVKAWRLTEEQVTMETLNKYHERQVKTRKSKDNLYVDGRVATFQEVKTVMAKHWERMVKDYKKRR